MHIGSRHSIQTILSFIVAGTEVELFAFHNVDCISQMTSLTYWHLLTRLRVSITKHCSTFLCLLHLSIRSLPSLSCGLHFLINQSPVKEQQQHASILLLAKTCTYILVSPRHHSGHLSLPLRSSFHSPQSHSAKTRSSLGLTMYISFTMFLFHFKNPRAYIAHSHVNFLVRSCISPVSASFYT